MPGDGGRSPNEDMLRLAVLMLFVFALGCADRGEEPRSMIAERMTLIVAHAQQEATDSRHRELLARGNVFVNLDGLDIPCVGVTVPNGGGEQRIHVSFTQEWFHSHSDDEIAAAVLEDLKVALAESASDR